MDELLTSFFSRIRAPESDEDSAGAFRVFREFLVQYQRVLTRAEDYLGELLSTTAQPYGDAYRPWKQALHDLVQGVYLTARRVPVQGGKFRKALQIFGLSSAADLLRDVCISAGVALKQGFAAMFRENMKVLVQAFEILTRARERGQAR